MINLKELLLQS